MLAVFVFVVYSRTEQNTINDSPISHCLVEMISRKTEERELPLRWGIFDYSLLT